MRWLSPDVPLVTEPGGEVVVELTNDEPIAAVLDRTVVDGMEWIRVQVGRGYAQDLVVNGWAPYAADIREGGRTIHVEPVYEEISPECPVGEPTVRDLDGMLPLLALHCFGSRTLTFSAVQVRDEGSEEAPLVDGSPAWLAEGGELAMYWFPEWREMGSIRIYIDPTSAVSAHPVGIAQRTWLEVSGQLDHPAARDCTRTSTHPEFGLANREEAIQICRGRFVVTGVRRLSEAEIPRRPARVERGPWPATTVPVAVRTTRAPIPVRFDVAAVWTGSEMLVWGGREWAPRQHELPRAGGAAYSPEDGTWRLISRGPLDPRAGHLAAWTGTEMLIWGGSGDDGAFHDGAAYAPQTDTWRRLPAAPLRWGRGAASVWTGTEWVIASTTRRGRIEVAAFDPGAMTWRSLPSPSERTDTSVQIAWTGSALLIMDTANGLLSMGVDWASWSRQEVDFRGPIVWTGEVLLGSRDGNLAQEPFGWEPWSYPVAWDPTTSSEVDIARPPDGTYGQAWTGRYLAFFEEGLALDMDSNAWLSLVIDRSQDVLMTRRVGAAIVWADDRLIVWGGWSACPGGYMPAYEVGYELIPDWPDADGVAAENGGSMLASRPGSQLPLMSAGVGSPASLVAAC